MKVCHYAVLAVALSVTSLFAQIQNHYTGASVTGQLVLTRTVNALQVANAPMGAAKALSGSGAPVSAIPGIEVSKLPSVFPHPAASSGHVSPSDHSFVASHLFAGGSFLPAMPDLLVNAASGSFGFNGLSHADQRLAASGNQFSVEPPNSSIAVANGYIVEGVNNAYRVFNLSGAALMPTISSNQLFGVTPAIDRTTGINGVFPTDMRVFFDQDINRWFVLQRSQDNDIYGDPLDESHIYLAVSQTADPTGNFNIYVMDTTDSQNPSCPCVPDYPQIGSDQYGFYISANEYNTSSISFADATILAISKTALASGVVTPTASMFTIGNFTGYEFAIQPASTPPGAVRFIASGGVEFFVSSQASIAIDSNLSIWALSNTATLQSANPGMLLTQASTQTLTYSFPSAAVQEVGPIPYGASLGEPEAFLDGGDDRVLSVVYSGGRLFATLATAVTDGTGQRLVGGAYVIFSPTFRGGVLAAPVLKQGYLVATNDNILRPAVSVNAQGRGAIGFTLVGPDYYPSAAFVSIDTTASSPSVIQIVGAGGAPEDGFTGYPGGTAPGTARWGDYSTAVTSTDGSIWMASEYIAPNANATRTPLANWGTFVSQYIP